jgi:hypothetical protein
MPLTPLQKKWIEVLKTTEEKQGRTLLCSVDNYVKRYCCLGIAAEFVLEEKGVLEPLYEGARQNIEGDFLFDGKQCSLSDSLREKLGLTVDGMNMCVDLNDYQRKSFRQIAEELEANPQLYFSKESGENDPHRQ